MVKYITCWLMLAALPMSAQALPDGATVTTVLVIDKASTSTPNYPVTFGHVFKAGDIPTGRYPGVRIGGIEYTTQSNIHNYYPDGSVRFAVISVIVPVVADSATQLVLYVATSTNTADQMDKSALLGTNIETEIRLTSISGCGYSGALTSDLSAQIDNDNYAYWLTGPICTEIVSEEQLNNSLSSEFEVRFYPTTDFGVRVSCVMANTESAYRGDVNYDLDIQAGMPALNSAYTQSNITHHAMGRWRRVFWVGSEPPLSEVHYDTDYIISTGHVMNYDTNIDVNTSGFAALYSGFQSDNNIGGDGYINPYLPSTGGSPHRGMLPTWAVQYLLSYDYRLREITLGYSHLYAEAPYHWDESTPSEPNYGGPIFITRGNNRVMTTGANANSSTFDPLGAALGPATSVWTLDLAHQPSFHYLPYLITGEKFYLDEMTYQACWNVSSRHFDTDWGRSYANGLLRDQVRGEAWAFRNIVDAATIHPDPTIRGYLETIIANNISAWDAEEGRYPLNWWGIDIYASIGSNLDGSAVEYVTSPWMESFMLMSLVHANEMGYNVSDIITWYSGFHVGMYTNTDFNPYLGPSYRFPTTYTAGYGGGYIQTWAEALSLYVSIPTSIADDDDAYGIIARAAISGVVDYPNGQEAYDWLSTELVGTDLATNPTWSIIPRSTANAPIVNAGSDQTVSANTATISGAATATEGRTITGVTCPGETVTPDDGAWDEQTEPWTCVLTGLEEGVTTKIFTGTDSAAETGTDSVTVTYTPTSSCSVNITSSPTSSQAGYTLTAALTAGTGTISAVAVNGISVDCVDGTCDEETEGLSYLVTLVAGNNPFEVAIADGGAGCSDSISVNYSSTPGHVMTIGNSGPPLHIGNSGAAITVSN